MSAILKNDGFVAFAVKFGIPLPDSWKQWYPILNQLPKTVENI